MVAKDFLSIEYKFRNEAGVIADNTKLAEEFLSTHDVSATKEEITFLLFRHDGVTLHVYVKYKKGSKNWNGATSSYLDKGIDWKTDLKSLPENQGKIEVQQIADILELETVGFEKLPNLELPQLLRPHFFTLQDSVAINAIYHFLEIKDVIISLGNQRLERHMKALDKTLNLSSSLPLKRGQYKRHEDKVHSYSTKPFEDDAFNNIDTRIIRNTTDQEFKLYVEEFLGEVLLSYSKKNISLEISNAVKKAFVAQRKTHTKKYPNGGSEGFNKWRNRNASSAFKLICKMASENLFRTVLKDLIHDTEKVTLNNERLKKREFFMEEPVMFFYSIFGMLSRLNFVTDETYRKLLERMERSKHLIEAIDYFIREANNISRVENTNWNWHFGHLPISLSEAFDACRYEFDDKALHHKKTLTSEFTLLYESMFLHEVFSEKYFQHCQNSSNHKKGIEVDWQDYLIN